MTPVRCLYSCKTCGIERQPVDVPSRDPSEDVVDWMTGTLARTIYVDHSARSPLCAADRISQVEIPMEPGEPVGVGTTPYAPLSN